MKKRLLILICLAVFMAIIPVAANIDYFAWVFHKETDEYVNASVISDISSAEYAPPENVTFTDKSDGEDATRSVKSLLRSLIGAVVEGDFEEHEVKALTVAYHTQICFNNDNDCLAIDTSDSTVCLSESELKSKFGSNLTTLCSHIDNVYNCLIMSDGQPSNLNISTLSDNYVENSAVMRTANPYSSLGSNYIALVSYSAEEFSEKLINLSEEADISNPQQAVGEITYDGNGDVKHIVIGGKNFDGKELAAQFSLPSNRYTLVYSLDEFTFTVMQHDTSNFLTPTAAHCMALQSNTYDEIINYYYRCNSE